MANVINTQVLQINRVTGKQEKNYTVVYKQHQGKRHMVVPVVIMVPGVHNGSHGNILHTAEELGRYVESWNGIPVLVGHPKVNGEDVSANNPALVDSSVIGRIYNAVYERGKLRAEAWIDEAKLKTNNAALIKHLTDGKPLEVSMGAYSDEEEVEGTWEGEKYQAISHNYRPDHLALLPDSVGACSWNDGGGVRTNEEKKIKKVGGKSMDKGIYEGMLASGYLIRPMPESVIQTDQEGIGYRELSTLVQQKLNPLDNSDYSHYLEEIYDGFVVYRVESRGPHYSTRLVKREYALSEQGTMIEFTGEPIPVVRKIQYMEQESIQGNEDGDIVSSISAPVETKFVRTKGVKMETKKEEKVLTQAEVTPVVTPVVEKAPVTNEAPQLNDDQLMALLSPAKRKEVELGLAVHAAQRKESTDFIVTNSNGVYSESDLVGMDDEGLGKLMKIIKPTANYSVASGGNKIQGNENKGEAPMLPAGMAVKK